ncbi:MAG: penicillin-binding transpeptidase domain-containing protein [Chloroflexota bacterium]|nr:penicillin-binding transpeptidase domain-containing protein [Chloroflexota bacterium]
MIYDPPGSRKRRRRPGSTHGAQELFLSRRMFIAKAGVVAVFTGLAARLGVLQLVRGEEYKTQAADNVIRPEVLPAPRGMILDRQGRHLARNRRAWEVRVVKAELPDDEAEQRRVLDMLISALQLEDVVAIRPKGVPAGSRDTVLQRVARMLYDGEEDQSIADRELARWLREWPDKLVRVAPVSLDDAAYFRAHAAELPGVLVMNEIDYLVGNIWASRLPITVKTDVPREVALKLEANSIYMPGVYVDDTALAREYPAGEVMSHVLGYVRSIDGASLDDLRNRDENNERIYDQNDTIGKEGLEQALEAQLRGVKGNRSVEVDANGVIMRTMPNSETPAQEGQSVRLTIDLELQNAVGNALRAGIERAAAGKEEVNRERAGKGERLWQVPNAGSAVAYDPRTGEVLAMVSYPYYDNQLFVTGISERKWNEYMLAEKGKAFLNRAVYELYPPGSTFKIFLAASALHHDAITPDKVHSCRGAIRVPNDWDLSQGTSMACWRGWTGGEHGELDLLGAIEGSCDVYFYNVAQEYVERPQAFDDLFYYDWNLLNGAVVSDTKHFFEGLGIDPLADDMQNRFWFGKATEIEILGEAIGLFPDPAWKQENIEGEGWAVGDTLNVSIGQGETKVTPLQLTMNTAALANGGSFKKPHLVHQWIDAEGKAIPVEVEEMGKLDIAQEHIDLVVEGMRRVVHEERGTANRTQVSDGVFETKWPKTNPEGEEEILIAGKTGTAEFGEIDKIGARDTHGWFTCFAPLEEAEIAVSVVIEAGGEGSTYAVPVADEILRAYFELTGKRQRGTVLRETVMGQTGEESSTPEATPGATPAASPAASTPVAD